MVGGWRAEQAGAARPGRHGDQLCAIGERRHPKGRSAAEQPASAGLTTIADRATADRLRPGFWIGCRHRFEQLPIGSEASSPAAAERKASAATLYSGDPCGSETMMQSCASAAKLRRAGPFYRTARRPWVGTGHCHLGSLSAASRRSGSAPNSLSPLFTHAIGHGGRPQATSGRSCRHTPSGSLPVVASSHNAINSLRASATIITFLVGPRPSWVRAKNH